MNYFFAKTISGNIKRFKYEDILFIEASGDYCYIKTEFSKDKIHTSLKKLNEILDPQMFSQIHKSYTCNLKNIEEIKGVAKRGFEVCMIDQIIPVGGTFSENLLSKLNIL